MNLDVRFVNKESEEMWQVRELYDSSFDDTIEYTEFFFKNIVHDRETEIIGGFMEDKLISVLFLRKKKLLSGGQRVNGCMIYGVATAEEYRGKGYMSELMECALSYCGSINIPFIYLIPVNPKIYSNMGFVLAREEKKVPLMDIEVNEEEYIVEKAYLDEEISPYNETLSFFSIMVEGWKNCITTEKNEHYFMRRIEQAEVENAGIYIVRGKNISDGMEDIEAIVVASTSEEDGMTYISDIICADEWEESLKYAKLIVDKEAGIMPFVNLKPIMIYNWTGTETSIKLNDEV